MTNTDIHNVTRVVMTHRQFNDPFSFYTLKLDCETSEGPTTVILYSKEKLTIEKAK